MADHVAARARAVKPASAIAPFPRNDLRQLRLRSPSRRAPRAPGRCPSMKLSMWAFPTGFHDGSNDRGWRYRQTAATARPTQSGTPARSGHCSAERPTAWRSRRTGESVRRVRSPGSTGRPRRSRLESPAVAEGDGVAGERLRVEARPSTVSLVRRAGSYVVNVLAELFGLPAPFGWPRIDVVVIDVTTGRTLRIWHEAGDAASVLLSVLNEELAEMPFGEFAEKWDLPHGATRRAGPGPRRRRGRRHRGGRDATRARRAGPRPRGRRGTRP